MHISTRVLDGSTLAAAAAFVIAAAWFGPSAIASPSAERSERAGTSGGWVCNAYGRGGSQRSVWQTVSGRRSASQASARSSAMNECQRRFAGCRPTGCWQG